MDNDILLTIVDTAIRDEKVDTNGVTLHPLEVLRHAIHSKSPLGWEHYSLLSTLVKNHLSKVLDRDYNR